MLNNPWPDTPLHDSYLKMFDHNYANPGSTNIAESHKYAVDSERVIGDLIWGVQERRLSVGNAARRVLANVDKKAPAKIEKMKFRTSDCFEAVHKFSRYLDEKGMMIETTPYLETVDVTEPNGNNYNFERLWQFYLPTHKSKFTLDSSVVIGDHELRSSYVLGDRGISYTTTEVPVQNSKSPRFNNTLPYAPLKRVWYSNEGLEKHFPLVPTNVKFHWNDVYQWENVTSITNANLAVFEKRVESPYVPYFGKPQLRRHCIRRGNDITMTTTDLQNRGQTLSELTTIGQIYHVTGRDLVDTLILRRVDGSLVKGDFYYDII